MKQIRSLKFREKIFLASFAMILIAFGLTLGSLQKGAHFNNEIMAAVSNPSPASPGYMIVVLPANGDFTSTATEYIKFKMPWPATLVGVSATVRSRTAGGVATVDVTEAGTSVLSSAISVTSDIVEGTISDSSIADEATIGITLTVTSGTWNDPTVQLNFKRK